MAQPSTASKPDAAPSLPPAKPAGRLGDRWTQWVALTTTILAVCAAISSLKGGAYSTKTTLATTRENDKWAQYQSKSIKENLFAVEQSLLQVQEKEVRTPEGKALVSARLAKLGAEIDRYEKEKAILKSQAEQIQADETSYQRIGGNFGLAIMLLQIAIMMSSVGALIKRPAMWIAGLVFGAAGLSYMANGFFGWW
jgi:hypothetical protein